MFWWTGGCLGMWEPTPWGTDPGGTLGTGNHGGTLEPFNMDTDFVILFHRLALMAPINKDL